MKRNHSRRRTEETSVPHQEKSECKNDDSSSNSASPSHNTTPRQADMKPCATARYLSLRILQASFAYFCVSVGAAAVLDTIRRMTLQIWLGKLVGVLAELPILLLVFRKTSSWCTRKFYIPSNLIPRLVMSMIAYVLFLLLEMRMMTVSDEGMTCKEFFKEYVSSFYQEFPSNLIGRLLEIVYPFMPLYQGLLEERKRKQRVNP